MRQYVLFRVSARDPGGGLKPAESLGTPDPVKRRLLTVFVHGFNNDKQKAEDNWDEKVWPGIKDRMQQKSDAMLFFWPSDPDVFKLLAPVLYASRVEIAISAGVEFAKYLKMIAGRNPDLRVQFVGYSLGCRVVLSAVQQLAEHPQQVPVVRVLLMGAAVPQGDCTAPGQWPDKVSTLFGAVRAEKISRKSDVILYSPNDDILGRKFDYGEKRARKRGLQSLGGEAVGLTGGPLNRWTNLVAFPGLRHTGYLSDEETLENVAAMFGKLINRKTPKRRDGKRFHEARQLGERQLATRKRFV